ncbi:glycosyltransferase family 4 protein [Nioella nitratireducens]|uniref:glycosyltransferase family 4 protein n=1 Tax=Nioella nitratireducens TaxID=1287720 RepID=UPI0008FD83DD|nr:glycosyltransferase family 1 protein [Nioella nitratireducens]
MTSPALCLDLTRLLSRVGRGPLTGVDRVERAYADWVLGVDPGAQFLFRTSRGYLMVNAGGARAFLAGLDGRLAWPKPDVLSRLTGKGDLARHRAEALLRRNALGRCLPSSLFRLLSQTLREGTIYLNTGHSNLTADCLRAFKANPDVSVAVLIHDLIPLDHPEFSRAHIPDHFRAMLGATRDHADLVICNSADTERRLADWMARDKAMVAAHLGLPELVEKQPLDRPIETNAPRFVVLGTIEPRKNHAVLLDAWTQLPQDALPHLHIVGQRGWATQDLLDRLDAHPLRDVAIFEHNDLSDGQVRTLLEGAHGLLFPTLAEGFGYPPLEAARLGTLPICSDLPVLRETLGDCGVYLEPLDAYSWAQTIKKRSEGSLVDTAGPAFDGPTWQAHFEAVSRALAEIGQGTRT